MGSGRRKGGEDFSLAVDCGDNDSNLWSLCTFWWEGKMLWYVFMHI